MALLGILGGTFNPVHTGHLAMARQALQRCGLERVIFMPSGNPPHKPLAEVTSDEDRFNMCSLAIAGEKRFCISGMELERKGLTYTYDTLKALAGIFPDCSLCYIIGSDTLLSLHTWHRAAETVRLARFIIIHRPGVDRRQADNARLQLTRTMGADFTDTGFTAPDISSTQIRRLIAEGQDAGALLPEGVYDYIKAHSLYGG